MSSLESALYSSAGVAPFVPTPEWQPILPGQTVPPGLWMRMDVSSGLRYARLMPQPGERVEPSPDTASSAAGDVSAGSSSGKAGRAGVRDDEFDDALPADSEGNTPQTFFNVYGPVFERNAKFSKAGQTSCSLTVYAGSRLLLPVIS
jgi:hypothetical protein